jgi:hypothetical protein
MSRIQLKGFEPVTTVNLCPSWETVAEICLMVLQNPSAEAQSIIDAEQQIRHMAKIAAAAVAEQEERS